MLFPYRLLQDIEFPVLYNRTLLMIYLGFFLTVYHVKLCIVNPSQHTENSSFLCSA